MSWGTDVAEGEFFDFSEGFCCRFVVAVILCLIDPPTFYGPSFLVLTLSVDRHALPLFSNLVVFRLLDSALRNFSNI